MPEPITNANLPVTCLEVTHYYPSEDDFQPGVYRHYKGGLYWAMTIGWINEVAENDRERAVFYLSLTTGEWHARPYTHLTKDAWADEVLVDATQPGGPLSRWRQQRFVYVGPQPIPAVGAPSAAQGSVAPAPGG